MKDFSSDILFSPLNVGALHLQHRIVMPPMTRQRAGTAGFPNEIMVKYYGQRATLGGLIITDATYVAVGGNAYLGSPAIYSDEHIEGFRRIGDAVHAKGGFIFAQLWHSGRTSHVSLQPGGRAPVGPSVVPYKGHAFTADGVVPVSPMRELGIEELPGIVEDFRKASERAKAAGLDGIELHSANGYLLDQFLQDNSNKRTDAYGGSVENRARLLLEVTAAMVSVWGPGRVGVRISPSGSFNDMADSNPDATFGYLAEELDSLPIAYLHVIEPRISADQEKVGAENDEAVASRKLRKFFRGTIIAAGGFTRLTAESILERGDADLVAFGRYFVSNPDLVERLRHNLPLNPYDRSTFYGGAESGYIDYPFFDESVGKKRSEVSS